MAMTRTTYRNLFDLLVSLGFSERTLEGPKDSRSFTHDQTDTILLFRRATTDQVTPADALSTEVHLQGKGIIAELLDALLGARAFAK
ncbi:MAG: hypothetical protein AB8G99_07245 [Planctomycetaceae bacterium]